VQTLPLCGSPSKQEPASQPPLATARASSPAAAAAAAMLRLGPAVCTFDVPVEWDDMDLTHDCYLLLACYQGGLRACDLSGRALSTWRPPKVGGVGGQPDSVVTVDCLGDGRVAAGLHTSRSVAILSYTAGWSDAWHEERRIPLKARPYRVSARGDDLLAIAGERPDGGGEHVTVVRLGGGAGGASETLQSLQLSGLCDIALTDNCLFAVREHTDVTSNRLAWVIEAYDRGGARLWQQAAATRVECIVAAPCGRILYVSAPGAKKVLEVSSDGRLLGNIVKCTDAKPGAIALSRGEQKMFAVASSNGRTFMMYPVIVA